MMASVLIVISVLYAIFIFLSIWGWKRTKMHLNGEINFKTKVSVIIPARNEEMNILHCLDSIAGQTFPGTLTEIIIVDDKSDDGTAAVVKNWVAAHSVNARIISPENGTGKKNAINDAVKIATGELIITTDADCTMGKEWLSSIVSYYEKHYPAVIVGPVSLHAKNNFLSSFQSLEFMGLTGIGTAGIYFKNPLLCNGANLSYTKKVFEETGGYNAAGETASGDDTMLMFRIAKQNSGAIQFLKSKEAIVFTNPVLSWNDLMTQRKRWGSKVISQKNMLAIVISVLVFFFHLGIIFSVVLFFIGVFSIKIPALLFGLKIVPEIIFLSDAISFFGKRKMWKYILPSQLVYPLYLVVAVLLSQSGKYRWKGRDVT